MSQQQQQQQSHSLKGDNENTVHPLPYCVAYWNNKLLDLAEGWHLVQSKYFAEPSTYRKSNTINYNSNCDRSHVLAFSLLLIPTIHSPELQNEGCYKSENGFSM